MWTLEDWCAAQILEPREETVGRSVIKHTNAELLIANSRLLSQPGDLEMDLSGDNPTQSMTFRFECFKLL